MHGGVHQVGQGGVVDGAVLDHRGQVEGAQVAGLVGQQGLLAAGVGGLDVAQVGHGVAAVDRVQEDDAGLAGGPGALDDEVEEGGGLDLFHLFAGAGVDQGKEPVLGSPPP